MAMREMHDNGGHDQENGEKHPEQGPKGEQHQDGGEDHPMHMLHQHHQRTLWIYWSLVMLGVWMMLAPITLGYDRGLVVPSGGREVWLSIEARSAAMKWSDIVSGLLLLIFGWRSLTSNRPISLWICCFVGIWLNMAPVIFWAPTAAAYVNGTMVGAWVIALTILIPGMPNMIRYMKMGGDLPPGWTYNPSSWPQRWIMIVTGFAGWMVSRYLAAFQLGYIDAVWDPFFGNGSRLVLNSDMSHMWPISDAGLGALAYTFEFLMGWMGAPSRWRTMPWMVTLFGILVIPLGLTHILLVISQPVVVGHWCTFCLLAAAIMLPMIPLEFDEVVAMGQHLVECKRRGEPFWQVFWKGGSPEGCGSDERSPALAELPQKPVAVFRASVWGMSMPWTLAISTLLGLWVMFVPGVFATAKPAADIEHLAGSLIVVTSVVCMGEVVRRGRYLNVLLGLVLAVMPWMVGGGNLPAQINDLVMGLLVAGLALPRGIIRERYGLWHRFVS